MNPRLSPAGWVQDAEGPYSSSHLNPVPQQCRRLGESGEAAVGVDLPLTVFLQAFLHGAPRSPPTGSTAGYGPGLADSPSRGE